MSITYNWKLTSIKKTSTPDLTDVIVQTYWEVTGTDENGNSGLFIGGTPFDKSTVNSTNFVPYESLTAEIVMSWVQSSVNATYWDRIEEQIIKQINDKINPIQEVSGNNFPWSV